MANGVSKTVLVVEDHADSRELLCEILENSGLSVVAAANGIEAIERMQSHVPHVVLTDMSMPEMNGIELARYIKSDERYGHIPVALISASLPAVSAHFPEVSVFLLKPCSVDHLLTTMAQLLR